MSRRPMVRFTCRFYTYSTPTSFGVTALHLGEDIGDTIKRADDALYQAKSNSRTCVQLA